MPQKIDGRHLTDIRELSTEGFTQVRASAATFNGTGVVGLEGGCRRVVAGTEMSQAESISKAIESVTGPRPGTHELMRDAISGLGAEVAMVKVTELRGENYIGRVLITGDNIILNLDARPSDGIALALRSNAPIYFNSTLLEERGRDVCGGRS